MADTAIAKDEVRAEATSMAAEVAAEVIAKAASIRGVGVMLTTTREQAERRRAALAAGRTGLVSWGGEPFQAEQPWWEETIWRKERRSGSQEKAREACSQCLRCSQLLNYLK